jgi:predicted nucleic acid-binding protein
MRSLIAMRSMITLNPALLLRAIEVYEVDRLDFAEAYLVACAENASVGTIASFDEAIDRVTTVTSGRPVLRRPSRSPVC